MLKGLERIDTKGLLDIVRNDVELYDTLPQDIVESIKFKDITIFQILIDRLMNE